MHRTKTGNDLYNTAKKYSLIKHIIEPHWDEYKRRKAAQGKKIHIRVYKAVVAMLRCRTPQNGANIYVCPHCGECITVYHSCKHRFCPQCGQIDINKWANKIVRSMLNIKHHHIVFTVPHSLNKLFRYNEKLLFKLLQKIAHKVLNDWFAAKHNIMPGIMCVLHTFGSNLQYHIHVHLVVSAGGLSFDTNELKELPGNWLVDRNWLVDQFRREFEGALIKLHEEGQLNYPPDIDEAYFLSFIKTLNTHKWICFIGNKPLRNVEDIVGYISRYTRRACISEYKIEKVTADEITIQYKDYKAVRGGQLKEIKKQGTYDWETFLDLLFQHIPHKHFRMVTYSGCYNNRNINKIPEKYKYQGKSAEANKVESYKDYLLQLGKENAMKCSHCQVEYLLLSTNYRQRTMKNLILPDVELKLSQKIHPLIKREIENMRDFRMLSKADLEALVERVNALNPEQIEERVKALNPEQIEERVKALNPEQIEERVKALNPEQIEERVKALNPESVIEGRTVKIAV